MKLDIRLMFVCGLCFCVLTSFAQQGVITSFTSNGELSWTHPPTNGRFTIEWASTPGGTWNDDWSMLRHIPSDTNSYTVQVPLFYRVSFEAVQPCVVSPAGVAGEPVGVGDGSNTIFSGVFNFSPVTAGTASISAGGFFVVDNGAGVLTGGNASGAIDYSTGSWSIDLQGVPLGTGVGIFADYAYTYEDCVPYGDGTTNNISGETIGVGNGWNTSFGGVLNLRPVVIGSLSISAGIYSFADNSNGTLTGDGVTGAINYQTGSWSINLQGIPLPDGTPIIANYQAFLPPPP